MSTAIDAQDDERPLVVQPNRRAFLAAFSQTCNVGKAAEIAGVSRRQHYRWLETDEAYKAAYALAREEAADTLEAEAVRRARDGVDEPVYGKLAGKDSGAGQIGTIRKYSDFLLMGLLRAHKPDAYSEKVQHQHSGSVEAKVSFYIPSNGRDADITVTALPTAQTGAEQTASDSDRHTPTRVRTQQQNRSDNPGDTGGAS